MSLSKDAKFLEAIENEDIEAVEKFISEGVNVHLNLIGECPLDVALRTFNEKIVDLLGSARQMPLMFMQKKMSEAVYSCSRTKSKMLAKHATLNASTIAGEPSFLYSAYKNDWKGVAETLISRGCSLKKENNSGYALLHLAAKDGAIEWIDILLKADLGIDDYNGLSQTPLQVAAQYGQVKMVQKLIDCGADILRTENMKSRASQSTPSPSHSVLHYAAYSKRADVVDVLFENNPNLDVNRVGRDEKTPLIIAIENDNLETVKALIRHGADVNLKINYETPLHLAVRKNNHKMVEVLLSHQANMHQQNKDGMTPISLALEKGFNRVLNLFKVPQKVVSAGRYILTDNQKSYEKQ